jgi:agmatine/peptidylarginine deiminase
MCLSHGIHVLAAEFEKQLFILIFWPNFTSLWKNVGWAKNIGRAKKLRKPEN